MSRRWACRPGPTPPGAQQVLAGGRERPLGAARAMGSCDRHRAVPDLARNPMSTAIWPSSPLDAAQRAFELLVCQPAPLAFDTRPFAGLPDEILPLDELRDLLLLPATGVPARDAVWRELVTRGRRGGPG